MQELLCFLRWSFLFAETLFITNYSTGSAAYVQSNSLEATQTRSADHSSMDHMEMDHSQMPGMSTPDTNTAESFLMNFATGTSFTATSLWVETSLFVSGLHRRRRNNVSIKFRKLAIMEEVSPV